METKGKASLWLCTTTWEIDQHCFRCSWPAHTTVAKASIPNSSMKDLKFEKPKVWTQEIITQHINDAEVSKKAQKEKKKS